jgi:predicted nucleotidyltransferase
LELAARRTILVGVVPSNAISPVVVSAVSRLRSALEARFGGRLRDVVLYGSYARGTATEDSDVDVLVVVDHLTDEESAAIARLAYFVDAELGHAWAGLEPLAMSTAHAEHLRRRERLLMRDIDREGRRFP